jgi:HSP20 family protein
MTLIKYRPATQIDTLFDRMARDMWPAWGRAFEDSGDAELQLPRTNITETEKDYVFTLEMPGLSKKDVEVTVENDTLTVKGEKLEKKETTEAKEHLRREIRSARFERSFYLGGSVDPDGIHASMENGVLTVTLSKKAEKIGRKIDVS